MRRGQRLKELCMHRGEIRENNEQIKMKDNLQEEIESNICETLYCTP